MFARHLVINFIVVLCFVAFASADSIILSPTDDMFTDPDHAVGHPVGELWTADWSPLGNYQRIMMVFELSSVSEDSITSAVLWVNRFFGCPSGDPTTTSFYAITQEWDESTWPEDQHASHGTEVFATYVFSSNGWHSIDLTSLARAWNTGQLPNFGLVVQASNSKFSKLYSKEASNQDVRPYLDIEYETNSAVGETPAAIADYSLSAYPNPFNQSTTVSFSLPRDMNAAVRIFNVQGGEVTNLTTGLLSAGQHDIPFHAAGLANGFYFISLETPGSRSVMKLLLVK